MNINILLLDNFTALDAFGPVEVLNKVEGWQTRFLSIEGGVIRNGQGINILTEAVTKEVLEEHLSIRQLLNLISAKRKLQSQRL